MGPKHFQGTFEAYTGKSGDHFVSVIPSLDISGYGYTIEESRKDLDYNIDVFLEDFSDMTMIEKHAELKRMGWEQNKYFKKKYSNSFVDSDGVLQNFDFPEQVIREKLQPVKAA